LPSQLTVAFCSAGQSELLQQLPFGMHELEALQYLNPDWHWQMPPGALQVWPGILQSALVQQLLLLMQLFRALHTFWPPGHWQEPPTPLQV
jgi:hypothetical protein